MVEPRMAVAVVALVGLATGAALVIFFLTGASLALGLGAVTLVVVTASGTAWLRLDSLLRRVVARRALVGLAAGLLGTMAYDLTRFAVVAVFRLSVQPFEAIPLFGQLLLSTDARSAVSDTVGVVYHLANGAGFGLAFAVVAGRRGVIAGIAWAMVLEVAMVTFYPGWLDIRAREEFLSVTVLGHVAYGAVLGGVARRFLPPARGALRS